MRVVILTALVLLGTTCIVQVESSVFEGIQDMLHLNGGKHEHDEEGHESPNHDFNEIDVEDHNQHEHYEHEEHEEHHEEEDDQNLYKGGFGAQMMHTGVDALGNRLTNYMKSHVDNGIGDAALTLIGDKLEEKLHETINERSETQEEHEERRRKKRNVKFEDVVLEAMRRNKSASEGANSSGLVVDKLVSDQLKRSKRSPPDNSKNSQKPTSTMSEDEQSQQNKAGEAEKDKLTSKKSEKGDNSTGEDGNATTGVNQMLQNAVGKVSSSLTGNESQPASKSGSAFMNVVDKVMDKNKPTGSAIGKLGNVIEKVIGNNSDTKVAEDSKSGDSEDDKPKATGGFMNIVSKVMDQKKSNQESR